MSSLNVIKDDSGATFIPSSQRPDGSWRKPIRVKDGYVPQEEQPLYVSKGKQYADRPDYPVGLSAADMESFTSKSSKGFSSGYFEVGNYQPVVAIPGLNFVETNDDKLVPKSKNKKTKKKTSESESGTALTTGKKTAAVAATNQQPCQNQTDPVKRLRNLRKRLKDIEALEKKIASGEVSNPEKEQLEKIKRKDEVVDEIEDLERLVEELNLS